DRDEFGTVLERGGLTSPTHGTAVTHQEAADIAEEIGYPVLARPSYVLGVRARQLGYGRTPPLDRTATAPEVTVARPEPGDRVPEDAIEIDVDALYDGEEVVSGGIMEHNEEAGIHPGDSACVLPSLTLGEDVLERVRQATLAIAEGVSVRGLLNIQFAMAAD